MHTETRQPICIANQSTGSHTARAPAKRKFQTNYNTHTKYKIQYLSPWYYFSLHYVIIIIYFDVGIYSLIQISFMFKNRPPPFVIFLVTFTYVKINFDQYLQLTSLKFCIKAKKRCYPLIVIYMKAMWK